MSGAIIVLNAGSSSIKFSLFDGHERPSRQSLICDGEFDGIAHRRHFVATDNERTSLAIEYLTEGTTHEDALATLLSWVGRQFRGYRMVGAGHRVVHGGSLYSAPVRIDATVIDELRRLIPLAPLHRPHNLAAIASLSKLHPNLPQIACFVTAFHHTQPAIATAFAMPRSITAQGVRRYGVHGLSYEYIASVIPDVLVRSPPMVASWSPISVAAPACARWIDARAWQRPWALPRSMGFRWAAAAVTWILASFSTRSSKTG